MILKMPDQRPGFRGVPEAEFAAMSLASAMGIPTPGIDLVDARTVVGLEDWSRDLPGKSFLIERYDRASDTRRVHAEEFAQVLGISTKAIDAKYLKANFETIANIVARLQGVDAVSEVIDRIVLNILIGNGDAHLKNWSFVYLDGKLPTLSPVYDVVPTVLYIPGDNLGLNLNGTKLFSEITANSFERLGERSGFGSAEARARAEHAVERAMDSWPLVGELLPREQSKILTERLESLPLVKSGNHRV